MSQKICKNALSVRRTSYEILFSDVTKYKIRNQQNKCPTKVKEKKSINYVKFVSSYSVRNIDVAGVSSPTKTLLLFNQKKYCPQKKDTKQNSTIKFPLQKWRKKGKI